jgi:L-fuconolactonase
MAGPHETPHGGLVIDGQLHEFGPRSGSAMNDAGVRRRLMAETTMAAMAAVGVDAALLHPTDVLWARELVHELPNNFVAIPTVWPALGDVRGQVLTAYNETGVMGVRVAPGYPRSGEGLRDLGSGAWEPAFDACEKLDFPVFVFISGNLQLLRPVLDAHPQLRVVVDHLGMRQPPTDVRDEPPLRDLPHLLDLASYPNVYIKLCGLPSLSAEPFPFTDMWPALLSIVEKFGAERAFWASDISRFQGRIAWGPPDRRGIQQYPGKHTYDESLRFIKDNRQLQAAQKSLLLGGTLTTLLNWHPVGTNDLGSCRVDLDQTSS